MYSHLIFRIDILAMYTFSLCVQEILVFFLRKYLNILFYNFSLACTIPFTFSHLVSAPKIFHWSQMFIVLHDVKRQNQQIITKNKCLFHTEKATAVTNKKVLLLSFLMINVSN